MTLLAIADGYPHLQFPPQQIRDHLPARHPGSPPQCREVQGTREGIRVAKAQHRRDPAPSILERETRFVHLILLDSAATEMVYAALGIDFRLIGSWRVGELRTGQDVEIVIGGVSACVTFGADCRA